MNSSFILVNCDVHCVSKTTHSTPVYRLYVNDELFAERSWLWNNAYLKELLQIQAPAGTYQIKLENLAKDLGDITMDNVCVKQGAARILENNYLEIQSCE
jgi:hypothetical protein